MKRVLAFCALVLALGMLSGCGVFDWDGSNARRAAQAEAAEEYARLSQERETTRRQQLEAENRAERLRQQQEAATEQARIVENAHTERVLILTNAHIEALQLQNQQLTLQLALLDKRLAELEAVKAAGTDHQGGVTAAVEVKAGAGIGWPVIFALGLVFVGGSYVISRLVRPQ